MKVFTRSDRAFHILTGRPSRSWNEPVQSRDDLSSFDETVDVRLLVDVLRCFCLGIVQWSEAVWKRCF